VEPGHPGLQTRSVTSPEALGQLQYILHGLPSNN
jgi:hypothetical protein